MSYLLDCMLSTASDKDLLTIIKDALNSAAESSYYDAQKRGFHQNEVIGSPTKEQIDEAAVKLHAEVSEFWEAAKKCVNSPVPDSKVPSLNVIEEELADIVIGAFEAAQTYGIDIGNAIIKKGDYNSTRPYLNGK